MPYDEAMRLARARTKTTPEALAVLAHHSSVEVRRAVAGNRMTPPEAFERLSRDPDSGVLGALARNPNFPSELEMNVFRRANRRALFDLADNTENPEVLEAVSKSRDPLVQQKASENPNTPTPILIRLLDSPHHYSRYWAGEQLVERGVYKKNPHGYDD